MCYISLMHNNLKTVSTTPKKVDTGLLILGGLSVVGCVGLIMVLWAIVKACAPVLFVLALIWAGVSVMKKGGNRE